MPIVAVRFWHAALGMGTLQWGDRGEDAAPTRFEPDAPDGAAPLAFRWTETAVGRQHRWPTRKADREEERRWQRFVTTDGATVLFRRDGPPPATAATVAM
jgi:hypothetical protein